VTLSLGRPGRKENGSSGTNRPKKLPFVPPLPLTAPDPGWAYVIPLRDL
jgi:hypothetical protein